MGPGRKMELPYRRYSVPETVMRKYWMSREKANSKNMVDKSAQTEWRPCVVWTEATSNGSVGRSASEPWLQGPVELRSINCRPATAPSTPSWSSTTLPPATTSAPTTSTSTSLLSTDPTRSPRPPPNVQVLCFHHGVSKSDVKIQFPEPSESSTSEGTPSYAEVGVNTDITPPPSPIPEETSHDVAVQTGSRPTTTSEDSLPNSKICQTNFSISPPPPTIPLPAVSKRVDFTCQTEGSLAKEKIANQEASVIINQSLEQISKEASCSTGNYKEYPGAEMIIPRYSAVPRTGSMVVNIPSMDNSDSDLSLTDSLEDPCEDLIISEWPENKLDNRLVRGEVSQIPITSNRSYIRSKNTCAYFLFLSGEEGSIKEYKVPHKLETRLRRKEEEIKKVYDLKYRKFPQITYRKKRRVQPIVLREMESQTNITKGLVNANAETSKKKFVTSKSFDSSCECKTNKKEHEDTASIKRLDRSKTISSFNIDSDQERNTGKIAAPNEDSSKSESSEGKTPRISLTLTVPSRSKRKDEESIDEKVARILIESLEEIRSQQHNAHDKSSEINKSDTTELSQHFIRKAQAMTKSIPGTSKPGPSEKVSITNYVRGDNYGAIKWEELRKKNLDEVMPALRSCQHPNIKYEEVRSRTRMREPIENEIYHHENTTESFPQSYLKVVKERRQYEQTCSHSEEDVSESKNGRSIEDEELLRAVLKKSMQPKGAPISSTSNAGEEKLKQDGHSDVCELGLKFLSNEIDIDQFIAGIPLERIEQDVKKLMYKHYLGTNPETKESDSAYETLMKKKMVVSFVDKEKKSPDKKSQALHEKTGKRSYRCCIRYGTAVPSQLRDVEQQNIKISEYDRLVSLGGPSESRGSHVCCHHCLTKDSEIYLSDDEPEKLEKSVSPLDKSVATAVQTIDSFLDSERLPVVNEITGSKFESILSSVKHNDHCNYNGDKTEIGYSKFCSCKNTNQGSSDNPHKNINPPNNHSPLNKSYYSPRPVKSCIKNNFEQKIEQRSDIEGQQIGSRKMPAKDTKVSKIQASKRSKNEINLANKDHTAHPKEPLEVKVVDNKGNILSRGVRNVPNRSEKKTTKLGISKKSTNPASKYTQMFEMIPEERNTPEYMEDCEHKLTEPRRKIKNQNMTPCGLPKQQSIKSHSMSTNTEQGDYVNATKKFVSKAVETISQKSVSTMVNFEQMGREDSRRSEMVRKDKSSRHYQPKTKPATGKSDRDIYIDDIKQQGDGKKGVVVGKYRPIPNKSELETHSVAKTKQGRPSNRQEASEDMLSLSKGWINFYLVRDNNDLTEFPETDNPRPYNGCDEEQHAYSRRSLQKGTQTLEKQVQLPNLSVLHARKCYKSSSDCSNISLPGIRSSSSSSPSSPENVPRSQFFRKPAEQLPQLGNDAYVKKKKKHNFYSSGEQTNKSDSGFSRDEERTTRRVEVSRSEQHSISSVTSSSIVLSGSPKGGRGQDRNQRKSKLTSSAPQSDAGSCWTVTVVGSGGTGNQPPPDVEMRLSFAGQREEGSPRPHVLCSTQATNLAVKSSKHHEIVEEKADSDTSLHYSSGDPLSSITMSKRVGAGRNQHSRYYEHEDYRQLKSRKCDSEEEWECERRDGVLHVTGSAITPEEKPRVPTQSERDLLNCSDRKKDKKQIEKLKTLQENQIPQTIPNEPETPTITT